MEPLGAPDLCLRNQADPPKSGRVPDGCWILLSVVYQIVFILKINQMVGLIMVQSVILLFFIDQKDPMLSFIRNISDPLILLYTLKCCKSNCMYFSNKIKSIGEFISYRPLVLFLC